DATQEPRLWPVEGEESSARGDEEKSRRIGVEGGGPDAAGEDGVESTVSVPEEERRAPTPPALRDKRAGAGEAEWVFAGADPSLDAAEPSQVEVSDRPVAIGRRPRDSVKPNRDRARVAVGTGGAP